MPTSTDTAACAARFDFGKNWSRFLKHLSQGRVLEAENSLQGMLDCHQLDGKRFLDVGCGSGLMSLAARRLGAKVCSFDYDPDSVACALQLRQQFFGEADPDWRIERGSALDREYLHSLGQFDIVYSWGVLHHTGHLWSALENVMLPVAPGGQLAISIYNDQGRRSRMWGRIKQTYSRLPAVLRPLYVVLAVSPMELALLLILGPAAYVRYWREYQKTRGMDRWHDMVDWVGGYPFEVAKPEEILHFYRKHRLSLERMKTCGGSIGCNEYVFSVPRA